jgi:aminomethyltransferase
MSGLRRTPLYETHRRLGARMVEFAGFEMPVQYTSILREHRAVREAAGLFDVSHMGQIALRGPAALAAADRLLSRRIGTQRPGRVRYALLCNEEGGVVDDVTAYRLAEDAAFLCVNAANVEKDYRWAVRHAPAEAGVRNTSEETGLLALQGPQAAPVFARLAWGSCRPGSVPATRCGSRPRCPCTDTSSTTRPPRWRPGWGASWTWMRADSSVPRRSRGAATRATRAP